MTDVNRPTSTTNTGGSEATGQTAAHPNRDTADMQSGEGAKMRDRDVELVLELSDELRAVRDRVVEAFGDVQTEARRGELTLIVPPERMVDVLRFVRDDPQLRCEMLADLTAVHWPGGKRVENAQETTGWPNYEFEQPGRIWIDYVVVSISKTHRFRLRAIVDDAAPSIASANDVYASAGWMECEAYDFFGIDFTGHPDLRRLHMPDDWVGHPQRKDYPLGGVDVQYKGALVPPPDQRKY